MDLFANVIELNIRRFQNLLDTSVDAAERETIKGLLDEEKAKALQIVEPKKQSAGRGRSIRL